MNEDTLLTLEIGLHLLENVEEIAEIVCQYRRDDCSGNDYFAEKCPMLLNSRGCIKCILERNILVIDCYRSLIFCRYLSF